MSILKKGISALAGAVMSAGVANAQPVEQEKIEILFGNICGSIAMAAIDDPNLPETVKEYPKTDSKYLNLERASDTADPSGTLYTAEIVVQNDPNDETIIQANFRTAINDDERTATISHTQTAPINFSITESFDIPENKPTETWSDDMIEEITTNYKKCLGIYGFNLTQ